MATNIPENCHCDAEITDTEDILNFYLVIVFLPMLSIFGCIGNAISAYIYSRPAKPPQNLYLAALSISDLGVCLCGAFMITADSLRSHSNIINLLWVFLLPILSPFGLFFQMLSIYVTVITSINCFIIVSWNFHRMKHWYCSKITTKRIIMTTVLLTALYNVIQFADLQTVRCYDESSNVMRFELCPTTFRTSTYYVNIYKVIMYAIVMAFFPFSLLIILVTNIISASKSNRDARDQSFVNFTVVNQTIRCASEGTVKVISCNEDDDNSPTTLILVILLFLACNSVSLIVNIFDIIPGIIPNSTNRMLADVGNVLVVFNSSANFFIYILFSSEYRTDFKEILDKMWQNIVKFIR